MLAARNPRRDVLMPSVRRGGTEPPGLARVVVADDHELTRAGLRAILAEDPHLKLVGEAATGRQALSLARTLHPDLVLMDVRMPDKDGLQATRELKQACPTI